MLVSRRGLLLNSRGMTGGRDDGEATSRQTSSLVNCQSQCNMCCIETNQVDEVGTLWGGGKGAAAAAAAEVRIKGLCVIIRLRMCSCSQSSRSWIGKAISRITLENQFSLLSVTKI